MAHAPSSSSRIVLPPIRTLLENLEMLEERPVLPSLDKIYDSHELDREGQQVQTTLRTSPPTLPSAPSSSVLPDAPRPPPQHTTRFIPTSLENANAVVVIPPPKGPNGLVEPLLLVGPALQRFRHSNRQLAKGYRVHPYRMVRGTPEPHISQRPPMGASTNMNV